MGRREGCNYPREEEIETDYPSSGEMVLEGIVRAGRGNGDVFVLRRGPISTESTNQQEKKPPYFPRWRLISRATATAIIIKRSLFLSLRQKFSRIYSLSLRRKKCAINRRGGEAPFLNQILGLMSRAKRGIANHRAAAARKKSPRNHLGRNFREPFLDGAGSSSAVKAPPLQHSWDDSGHFAAAAAVRKRRGNIPPRAEKSPRVAPSTF